MKSYSPKVSIAVPVYGVEKLIERCAVSLFEQTYANLEFVFVDDCSKDNSLNVLKRVLLRYPTRISQTKIITHSVNKGLASTRNTAVLNSTGEFIVHVDSDDYLDVDTIQILVNKQLEDDSDIVSFDYIVYRPKYIEYWRHPDCTDAHDLLKLILSRDAPVCVAGRLIRLDLYKRNHIAAIAGLNMAEDYTVSPFLFYYAKKIAVVHQFLYHYDCTNETSYTYSFSEDKSSQLWKVHEYLEESFSHLDPTFSISLQKAKIKLVARQIIDSCLSNKSYCRMIKSKLTESDKLYYNTVPMNQRLLLYINYIPIIQLYVRLVRPFNTLKKYLLHR